jgi:hypothetical protein
MASENSTTNGETPAPAPSAETHPEIEDLAVGVDRAAQDAQLLVAHVAEAGCPRRSH